MSSENEVHTSLQRLRQLAGLQALETSYRAVEEPQPAASPPVQSPVQPAKQHGQHGQHGQPEQTPVPQNVQPERKTQEDEKRPGLIARIFLFLFGPLISIQSVMHELSPSGLAERGIPFAKSLKMPKSVLFASIIINLFGLALPLVILQVYDRIIPNQAIDTFALMALGLGVIVLIEGVLRIARSYVISWSATRFTKAIMQDLIARFLYAPTGAFAGTLESKTIEKLSNINRIAEFYGGQSRLMFIDLPFALLFLAVMGIIGGWLVVVPFIILCFFGAATIASSRHYKNILEKKEEHEARIYDFVAETLNGILTMKSQAAEPLLMRRFERLQSTNAQLHYSIITTAMKGQSIASLLGNGTMIAMVTTGAILAVDGKMTVGVLACCSLLSGRAVQPILRVASTWNEFQSARISVEEVAKLFEINHVPTAHLIEDETPTPSITARDLRLKIGKSNRLLDHVSFHIEPGEVIALVARDGSGKSTLLKTIAGLMPPASGDILLNNAPAYDFRRMYRSAVGVSDASSEVFTGTIFDNMSLFGQGATAEDVRWAANQIDLEREIDHLPEGYDTPLGRGIAETLPAGFVNRIMHARVLAQKPGLWVLDEPQGGLDARGEQAMLNAIDNLRGWITFVYSTHSENFIKLADRIMTIEDDQVLFYNSYADYQTAMNRNEDAMSADYEAAFETAVTS